MDTLFFGLAHLITSANLGAVMTVDLHQSTAVSLGSHFVGSVLSVGQLLWTQKGLDKVDTPPPLSNEQFCAEKIRSEQECLLDTPFSARDNIVKQQ